MLTLMAVHAHPDDEATSTGGALARYAAEGVRTVLVTCTDGRCGDGPGGVKPGDPGHDPATVVAMRRKELEASCGILKVSDLELLGYGDSGMMGWAQNEAPGSFWGTPVPEAAARLAALIEKYRPDVVVTYDAFGFYGHPDHIQAHRITMAAVEQTGSAAKVYWSTVPRSWMERMGEFMREAGLDEPEAEQAEQQQAEQQQTEQQQADAPTGEEQPPIGLPEDEITTWVDVREWAGQKFDALSAHASQSDIDFFKSLGRERFMEFMGIETYLRVDAAATGEREDDLLAGLRP